MEIQKSYLFLVTKKQDVLKVPAELSVCPECKRRELGALTECCFEQYPCGSRVSISLGEDENCPGGNKMSKPPLCAHLCHLLRGQTRMITPGRTPTTWLPKSPPRLMNRHSPNMPSSCCFAPGSGGSLTPCSSSQQEYHQHFGQGHALPYHMDCPPLQGIYSCNHIPSNASHSYYENQNHNQAFPKAPRVAALSLIENHGSIHR